MAGRTNTIRSVAELIHQACLLEVLAPKPGNVHPGASFDDCGIGDFVRSAAACAEPLAAAIHKGIGPAVFASVRHVQQVTRANTNLGILLLLAPLAAVPRQLPLVDGIADVLNNTSLADAEDVYAAIRLASPGGLGETGEGDVRDSPAGSLTECMRLAAERDTIAQQYASDFALVLRDGQQMLHRAQQIGREPLEKIVVLALSLMAETPDSLIARKCGAGLAAEAAERAAFVLQTGTPEAADWHQRLRSFDEWLRADGNRRNPGTTADLIAAILFAALRDHAYDPGIVVVTSSGDIRLERQQ